MMFINLLLYGLKDRTTGVRKKNGASLFLYGYKCVIDDLIC